VYVIAKWDHSYWKFSDISLQSSPLRTGHRLALRYPLKHQYGEAGELDSAAIVSKDMSNLQFLLSSWMQQLDFACNKHFGYLLDEKLPAARLSH